MADVFCSEFVKALCAANRRGQNCKCQKKQKRCYHPPASDTLGTLISRRWRFAARMMFSQFTRTLISQFWSLFLGGETISDKGISIKINIPLLFLLTCGFVHIHTAATQSRLQKNRFSSFSAKQSSRSLCAPLFATLFQLLRNKSSLFVLVHEKRAAVNGESGPERVQ